MAKETLIERLATQLFIKCIEKHVSNPIYDSRYLITPQLGYHYLTKTKEKTETQGVFRNVASDYVISWRRPNSQHKTVHNHRHQEKKLQPLNIHKHIQ